MTDSRRHLHALLRSIAETRVTELDCDEFLERVAPLLEAIAADRELSTELAPVAQHLLVCPECKEEFDALLRAHGLEP